MSTNRKLMVVAISTALYLILPASADARDGVGTQNKSMISNNVASVTQDQSQSTAPQNNAKSNDKNAYQKKKKAQTLATVVVTGIEKSLQESLFRQRYSSEIMNSIVSQGIGKLPDTNLADALERVPGVQVTQNLGEGQTVSIRGLTQIETELDGVPIFTASGGRGLNYQDIPAGLLAGVDIYKTPAARQIEGGIGGIVNIRTYRPFDFNGFKAVASVGATYADGADRTKPRFSALISNTWDTGLGKFGALLGVAYDSRPFLEQYTELTQPGTLSNATVGSGSNAKIVPTVYYPQGDYLAYNYGTQTQEGVTNSFQWQPNKHLQFYMDNFFVNFKTNENTSAMYNNLSFPSSVNNISLYPGTSDLASGTFNTVGLEPESFITNSFDKTYQSTLGAIWDSGAWTVHGIVSYTHGTHQELFNELSLYKTETAPLTLDTTPIVPSLNYGGFDITDPANFNFNTVNYYRGDNLGQQRTAQIDTTYETNNSFLQAIKFGVRVANRDATNASVDSVLYQTNASPDYFGQPGSLLPGLLGLPPYSGIGQWVSPNPGDVADVVSLFKLFGLGAPPPPLPLSTYELSANTTAGYLEGVFGTNGAIPMSGNLGVRLVRTAQTVDGFESVNGAVSPLSDHSSYFNALPSLNLTFNLTHDLQLRFAASKTMTRPNFSDLTPSLTLTPEFDTGSAGNPNLKPMTATGYDGALAWYFNKSGYLYGDAFFQKVNGFISQVVNVEQYFGTNYQITRPINANSGDLKGVELAYQQFYPFLPGLLRHLGTQLNYTYVNSSVSGIIPGRQTSLPDLSKNSFNAILTYDAHSFWARAGYYWRGGFLESTYYTNTSLEPIYSNSYGSVFASIGFKLTPSATLVISGVNLTRARSTSYYLRSTLPDAAYLEDRRIQVDLRLTL